MADKTNPDVQQDALRLLPPAAAAADSSAGGGPAAAGPSGTVTRQPNGGLVASSNAAAAAAGVPEHLNLFVQYSQVQPQYDRRRGYPGSDDGRYSSGHGGGGERGDREARERRRRMRAADGGMLPRSASSSTTTKRTTFSLQNAHQTTALLDAKSHPSSAAAVAPTSRRPLLFTFNVNGSMVDIRCGEEERTNTFRLIPEVEDYPRWPEVEEEEEEVDLGDGSTEISVVAPADERHYHGNNHRGNLRRYPGNHSSSAAVGGARSHADSTLGPNYRHLNKPGIYGIQGSIRTGHDRIKDSSEDEEVLLWNKHRSG